MKEVSIIERDDSMEWDDDLIEFQEIELLLEGLEIEGEY